MKNAQIQFSEAVCVSAEHGGLESMSATALALPGRYSREKLNCCNCKPHLASLPVGDFSVSNHFSGWWSVSNLTSAPSIYPRNLLQAHTIAKASRSVVE